MKFKTVKEQQDKGSVDFNNLDDSAPSSKSQKKPNQTYNSQPNPITSRHYLDSLNYYATLNRRTFIISVVSIVFAIIATLFAIKQTANVKTVPFVIMKDSIGNLTPLGIAGGQQGLEVDEKVVVNQLSTYIYDLREVYLNSSDLMLRHIKTLIAMTSQQQQQHIKSIMLEQVKNQQPYRVSINQVIKISGVTNGWKINWTEDDGSSNLTYYEATVVLTYLPQGSLDMKMMMLNPTGMQVTEFNMVKQLTPSTSPDALANQIVNTN